MSIAARCVHGVGLCALPSEGNDFRPLVLRHKPLALLSALLITAKILALGTIALIPETAELSTITSARIVQLTNTKRVENGLKALTTSSKLTNAAQQKGQHMLAEDYFAHISPSGVTPWFWMSKVGYTYQVAGENLAIEFSEAEDVVAAWLASPTHKDNMLHSAYTETGVAVVTGEFQGGTSTIVVHMFGLPDGQPAAPPASAKPTPTPSVEAERSVTPTPPPPTPTPLPPSDTSPPRIPRIAIVGQAETVREVAALEITGDVGSTIHLLINGQVREQVLLREETATYDLNVGDVADGTLVVRAFATDGVQNESSLSNPLALTKDTSGPKLAREDLTFILSPATDAPAAHVTLRGAEAVAIQLAVAGDVQNIPRTDSFHVSLGNQPVSLALQDEVGNVSEAVELNLTPQFSVEEEEIVTSSPARLSRATRWMAALVFISILTFLSLAILVRIHIQRPALISHATFVLLLAMTLFFL